MQCCLSGATLPTNEPQSGDSEQSELRKPAGARHILERMGDGGLPSNQWFGEPQQAMHAPPPQLGFVQKSGERQSSRNRQWFSRWCSYAATVCLTQLSPRLCLGLESTKRCFSRWQYCQLTGACQLTKAYQVSEACSFKPRNFFQMGAYYFFPAASEYSFERPLELEI